MLFEEERSRLCTIAASMYGRQLTNAAGGNLSEKVGEDRYVMTASALSSHRLWSITPEDVLVVTGELEVIEGRGKPTREINMHMELYRNDPRVTAVIHAHPRDLMVYAAMGAPMPLVCEAVEYLGKELPCLPYRMATSLELAQAVGAWAGEFSKEFAAKEFAMEDIYAYGVLLRRHGVIVGAHGSWEANEMLERLETNAYVHLHASVLEQRGYAWRR